MRHALILTILATFLLVSSVQASMMILTPVAAGGTGGYYPLEKGFNNQPIWDDVLGEPVGDGDGHSAIGGYSDRYGYIDFGEDYADLRIYQTWTRYRPYSGGDQVPYTDLWWDDDTDTSNDDGVIESLLNFQTALGLPSSGVELWSQDTDLGAAPITPARQYLLVHTGANNRDRANELAFVGEIVPEPITLGMIALGGLAMIRNKR
jgi:hypothetical protein